MEGTRALVPSSDKLERALRQSPHSVRVAQLVAALEARGFDCRRTANGHWLCFHPQHSLDVHFAEPHGQGDSFVKLPYVRKAIRALDAVQAAEEND